jgi:excisionase family DNA binding protein
MEASVTEEGRKLAWSVAEISEATGLSPGFLRNEVRRGELPTRRFGRRVLVLDRDLQAYLNSGSNRKKRNTDEV